MHSGPLVSIVMPYLNAAAFIGEAIDSVLSQTYPNWELVLIDDGGTDGSTQIAQRYALRYPGRVLCLQHPGRENRGISASRGLGIRRSAGEYIAYLDADDVYMPQKLEQQVCILEKYPGAGLVYSASCYWHSWTGDVRDVARDHIAELGVASDFLYEPARLLVVYLGNGAVVPCPGGWLARRSIAESVVATDDPFGTRFGIAVDDRTRHVLGTLYEDQVFLAQMCLAAPVFVASGCWDRYRQHAASVTARARPQIWHRKLQPDAARLVFLDWLQAYITLRDIRHRELWSALRSARWPYRHPFLYAVIAAGRSFSRKAERLWGRTSRVPAKRSRAS